MLLGKVLKKRKIMVRIYKHLLHFKDDINEIVVGYLFNCNQHEDDYKFK